MNNKRSKQLRKMAKELHNVENVVVERRLVTKRDRSGELVQRVVLSHKVGTYRSVYQRLKRAFMQGRMVNAS